MRTFCRRKRKSFVSGEVLIIFHFIIWTIEKMFGGFVLVRYFSIVPPIDNIDDFLNLVCLRWATDEKCGHTVTWSDTMMTILKLENGTELHALGL